MLGGGDVADILRETLREDDVNLFQTAPGSFWIEEVNDRKETSIDNREEEIGAPRNAFKHDGGDHNDEEVKKPVGAGGQSVGFRAGLDRGNFCRVKPRQRKPCGAKTGDIREETNGGTDGRALPVRDQAGKRDYHGKALPDSPVEEQLAPADSFDQEPGHSSENRVNNHVNSAKQHGHFVGLFDGRLEENGEIIDDCVTATDLLHELRGHTKHHSTEMLRFPTGEDGGKRGRLSCLTGTIETG